MLEAKIWWRSLSLNEQKDFARKHLLDFEYSMLMGSMSKYTSPKKWDSLIQKVWQNEKSI